MQTRLAFEALCFTVVDRGNDDAMKGLRLLVKRRLYDVEGLAEMDALQRKTLLDSLYADEEALLLSYVRKLGYLASG